MQVACAGRVLTKNVGTSTAIFSLVSMVPFKPLTYVDADRSINVRESASRFRGISVVFL